MSARDEEPQVPISATRIDRDESAAQKENSQTAAHDHPETVEAARHGLIAKVAQYRHVGHGDAQDTERGQRLQAVLDAIDALIAQVRAEGAAQIETLTERWRRQQDVIEAYQQEREADQDRLLVLLLRAEAAEARVAALEAELHEWKAGHMADATGHMFRCAKVNGVWNCAKGCAVKRVAALEQQDRQTSHDRG